MRYNRKTKGIFDFAASTSSSPLDTSLVKPVVLHEKQENAGIVLLLKGWIEDHGSRALKLAVDRIFFAFV
jgi:hypothetical protein